MMKIISNDNMSLFGGVSEDQVYVFTKVDYTGITLK